MRPKPSPGGTPRWKRLLKLALKVAFVLALVFVPLGLGVAYVVVTRLSADLPDVAGLATYEVPQTSRILARDGQVVATLFVENRTKVPLDHMSPYLVKALLAVEDSRFYGHSGVDWVGVGRAAVANVLFRGIDQGASTLTMQLARNRFLNQDQTMARKIREIVLALRIEKKYSKEKILEYYLNNVYFGSGAYGVAAASSLYFGHTPDKLSIAQAALIAGLVQAPSSLSPLVDREASIERMKIVLGRMRDTQLITQEQYDQAIAQGEAFRFGKGTPTASASSEQLLKYPYFTTYVIAELADRYPEDMLYRSGLQISTTLDVELQRIAERELSTVLGEQGYDLNAQNGALVLIENTTGSIRAMVGGRDWNEENQFNRAWQAQRQPGSSFKAFVYAAALLQGMTPETIVDDSPTDFGGWAPKNSDGKFKGKIPLRQALQESRNVVAARLCETVGAQRVAEVAHALGIREELKTHLALALGACEVSPLSMASAYSTIASGGQFLPPLSVSRVVDAQGKSLTDNRNLKARQILPADVSAQLTSMLMGVVQNGTGTAAYLDGVDVAGKTGTTDDSRDAWFVGFTPEYTLAVWVGNDDHSSMYDVYGGGLPATIWRRVMGSIVDRGIANPRFTFAGAKSQVVKVCRESGMLAHPNCTKTQEVRIFGEIPSQLCAQHEATPTPTATALPEEALPEETPEPVSTPIPLPESPIPGEDPLPPEPLITPLPE